MKEASRIKTKPDTPWSEETPGEVPENEAESGSHHGPNGSKMAPLSFRRVDEILAMNFDDSDFITKNGYVAKGDPFAICGAAGIGKSRLILQLLIAIITGRDFLGWPTNGKGTHWLLLQTENICRRLKSDLWAMCSGLSIEEKQLVNECLLIHTLENGDDSFLHLNVAENQERVSAAVAQRMWTGVIFDVLRDYSVDDLNSDQGMQETLAVISRLVRKNNPHCIIGIMQHARTGKAGAASMIGFDRTSFGRNSKVLLSWVRAQINAAPYNPDDNEILIIASAKCNNAQEFAPFAIRLDFKTMMYERDDSIDIDEWKERVGGNGSGNARKQRKTPNEIKAAIMKHVPEFQPVHKKDVMAAAVVDGISRDTVRDFVRVLLLEQQLFEWKIKRDRVYEVHLARYQQRTA